MTNENSFDRECIDSMTSCTEKANDVIACIAEDEPTTGGQEAWEVFKSQKPPEPPRPQPKEDTCVYWKIASLSQTALTTLTITAMGMIKLMIFMRTRRYEAIVNVPDNGLYQSTIENIPNP